MPLYDNLMIQGGMLRFSWQRMIERKNRDGGKSYEEIPGEKGRFLADTGRKMRNRFVKWYVLALFSVWCGINTNISLIIEIFVYQQEGRIFERRSDGLMLEYTFLVIFGLYVFLLLSRCEESVKREVICVILLIAAGFYISDWKQPYIEYSIVDDVLKAACYVTLRNLRLSHFLWLPIWHGTRFLARKPIEWGYELVIPIMIMPSIGLIGGFIVQFMMGRLF